MKFLAKYKEIVKNRSPDVKTFTSFVTGVTFTANARLGGERDRQDYVRSSRGIKNTRPCLACDDLATNTDSIMHMLADRDVWKGLSLSQKEEKVQCFKHPWTMQHTMVDCKYKSFCRNFGSADHHRVLCPKIVKATTNVCQVASDDEEISDDLRSHSGGKQGLPSAGQGRQQQGSCS